MDFGTLLYAAHKNEKTANKDVSFMNVRLLKFETMFWFHL